MKFKILSILALTVSMLGNAAASSLTIVGSVTPWAPNATSVALDTNGTVPVATGIFEPLVNGTAINLATVIGLDITEGDFSSSPIRVFDDFKKINPGFVTLSNTYFDLLSVDNVVRTTTATGQTLSIDTQLQAIINGVDEGIFLFRWELSHNGTTGSYSVSTPVSAVPVPAAAWLFGSALLGMVSFTKRKKSGIEV